MFWKSVLVFVVTAILQFAVGFNHHRARAEYTPFQCPKPQQGIHLISRYADDTDCTRYYFCLYGKTHPLRCPKDSYFSGITLRCEEATSRNECDKLNVLQNKRRYPRSVQGDPAYSEALSEAEALLEQAGYGDDGDVNTDSTYGSGVNTEGSALNNENTNGGVETETGEGDKSKKELSVSDNTEIIVGLKDETEEIDANEEDRENVNGESEEINEGSGVITGKASSTEQNSSGDGSNEYVSQSSGDSAKLIEKDEEDPSSGDDEYKQLRETSSGDGDDEVNQNKDTRARENSDSQSTKESNFLTELENEFLNALLFS